MCTCCDEKPSGGGLLEPVELAGRSNRVVVRRRRRIVEAGGSAGSGDDRRITWRAEQRKDAMAVVFLHHQRGHAKPGATLRAIEGVDIRHEVQMICPGCTRWHPARTRAIGDQTTSQVRAV